MKSIIINNDNLNEEEITDFTTKVKLLLINSNNELLLGYSNNEYQFPGGTQEDGESLIDTVKRELMEETGIEIKDYLLESFAKSTGYYKDWPKIGRNKKVEIYYYEIRTDEKPNIKKMNLTEMERKNNFELRYVLLNEAEFVLEENMLEYGDVHGIGKEMINLLKIYKCFLENK